MSKKDRLVNKLREAVEHDNWQGTTRDMMAFLNVKQRADVNDIKHEVTKQLAAENGTYFEYDDRRTKEWPYGRFRNARTRRTILELLKQNTVRAAYRNGDTISGVVAARSAGYVTVDSSKGVITELREASRLIVNAPRGLEWVITPPDLDDDGNEPPTVPALV
jgi:hypothetical protein